MINIDSIKNKYSTEIALIVLLIRLSFDKASTEDCKVFVSKNEIDWDLFYKLARAHQVRPFLYKLIAANNIPVKEDILRKLREDTLHIAATNLENLHELTKLCKMFAGSGIDVVPYKGVVLSQHLFNDFITRETCDIDFLIKAENFSKVREAMLSLGYQTNYYYSKEYEDVILKTGCEYQFYREGINGLLKVEIHWELISKMQDVPIANEYLLERCMSERIVETNINVLNPNAELLTLLIHHGVNDVWRSLRHVLDMAAMAHVYSDRIGWQKFQQEVKRFKVKNAAAIGFTLSRELFGVESPVAGYTDKRTIGMVVCNLLKYPLLTKHKLVIANFKQQLLIRDNLKDKARLCLRYFIGGITPNVRDIERIYLARKWFFLYYLIKPFRFIRSRKSK